MVATSDECHPSALIVGTALVVGQGVPQCFALA